MEIIIIIMSTPIIYLCICTDTVLQTSVSISNYNITSLICKLTSGQEYSTIIKSSSPDQRSSSDERCHYQQEVAIEEIDKEESGSGVTSQEGANVDDCTSSRPKGPIVNGKC